MKKLEKIKNRYNSYLYNHLWLKYVIEYGFAVIVTLLSAAIFAFGINVFLAPSITVTEGGKAVISMVSGGSSGVAQVIDSIFKLNGVTIPNNPSLIYSIFYLLVNIPLVILAFKGIGKRFAVFTLLNVATVFLFSNLFHGQFFDQISSFVMDNGGLVARVLFAGMCTGLSSGLAFKIDASAGGIDIVSLYVSIKKSTLVGKYNIIINMIIIIAYSIVNSIGVNNFPQSLSLALFSVIYLFTTALVVDSINIRNKKAQVQIITSKPNLSKLLLANIPHGATVVDAKGAYSDSERFIIYMVISTTEIKKAITVIKQLDPESFVHVTQLTQVYGHFYIKPIK